MSCATTCATSAVPWPVRPATAGRIPSGSGASAMWSRTPRPRSRRFSPSNRRRKSKSLDPSRLFSSPACGGGAGWGPSLQVPAHDPTPDPLLEEAFFNGVGAAGLQVDQLAVDQGLDRALHRRRRTEVRPTAVVLAIDVAATPFDE